CGTATRVKGYNRVNYCALRFANRRVTFGRMKIDLHFAKSTVAGFLTARRQLRFKLTCAIAALAFSASGATAQTTAAGKSFPIRGGTQPFAITMGEDGNFWFTLANSSKVARISSNGTIKYSRTPSLTNPAFITPGPDGNIWFGEGSSGKIA